ncbi:MAG: lamin tail domain-containing protein [Chloroflexi bacterium]|nr:lamin tail domain-containing protein [Chloroflexota bacterium]MCY3697750.1 lamin tail domain-containing protein [Chloroflexota bacterium]
MIAIAGGLFSLGETGRPATASHNPQLVISEVYPNALGSGSPLETSEWVEVQNLETHGVSLSGWMIEDAQAVAALPDIRLPPRSAVLIVGRANAISVSASNTLIVLDSAAIGTGLRNRGDRVALIDPQGVRHDAVSWGDVRSPRFMEPPESGESIVRTASGHQRISDEASPWLVPEALAAQSDHHGHPRPDTRMRIVGASLKHQDEQEETVTIRNIGRESLLTINWSLTIGRSSVTVRSVLIRPGDTYQVRGSDGAFGSGLRRAGGRLVLRDQYGNWLATASWGDDHTFHRQASPDEGQDILFNPRARTHPRIPWYDSWSGGNNFQVSALRSAVCDGCHSSIARRLEYERPRPATGNAVQQNDQDLWISEVYPNAGQGRNDASYEWFELTNRSNTTIDLNGWTIQDNTSSDPLDGLVVAPHTSVVIAVDSDADLQVDLHIGDDRIGNGLANAGDRLELVDPDGHVVSAISWGNDRTHNSTDAPDEGKSIHRAQPDGPPKIGTPNPGELATASQEAPAEEEEDSTTATAAESKPETAESAPESETPTPAATSAAIAAVQITEILPAPQSGQPEWIELLNVSDHPIDLSGWSIGDLGGRTELSGVVPPGGRLVIATQVFESDGAILVVERIGNGLNNDADTIFMYAPDGREVDRVTYGMDELPAPGSGLSLALDPARWVVTARPSPGSDDVVPLLGDAFQGAVIKEPISDQGRLPVVQAEPEDGVNAWMIVSFALIGVILTLSLRRWQPGPVPQEPQTEAARFQGSPQTAEAELESLPDTEDRRE